MRPVLRVALACAAVAVGTVAGGCGEDREDDQAVTAGADTATGTLPAGPEGPAAATVRVSETEFALDPPNLRVVRPGVIVFEVANDGEVPHALAVAGPAAQARTPVLAPGQATTLRVALPAGTYKWSCPLADHERRGMAGRVRVAE